MCPQKHARGIAVESIAASFSPVHALIRVDVIDEGSSLPPPSLTLVTTNKSKEYQFFLSLSFFLVILIYKLLLLLSLFYLHTHRGGGLHI
jgi:hypothetical protein